MVQKVSLVVNNVPYSSVASACKELKIPKSKLYKRAEQLNKSIEELMNYFVIHGDFPSVQKVYTVYGKDFGSIQQICDHYGLVAASANELRKNHNFTWEQTIEYYQAKRNGELPNRYEVDVEGITFASIVKACEYFGYNYDAVKNLSYYEYMNMQEALTMYVSGEYPSFPKRCVVGRVEYPTLKALFEAFGMYFSWSMKVANQPAVTPEDVVRKRLPLVMKRQWAEEVVKFGTKNIGFDDLLNQVVATGLNPSKLWRYFEERGHFPDVSGEGIYIQYHTFPSIELACLHFDLDIQEVMKLIDTYSPNGVFTYLLKEK